MYEMHVTYTVANPGIPMKGVDLVAGASTPKAVTFWNFVCQNERIWTQVACAGHATPRSANDICVYVNISFTEIYPELRS